VKAAVVRAMAAGETEMTRAEAREEATAGEGVEMGVERAVVIAAKRAVEMVVAREVAAKEAAARAPVALAMSYPRR